jgi:hypothetical protein
METALLVILIAAGVAALVTIIVVLAKRAAARRRAALEALALESGWSFSADAVEPDALGAGLFPLFTHGRARKARNVMRLTGSAPAATVFDYEYTVGGGQHQNTVVQTVVHVGSPRFSLPPFVLGPENIFHKVGGLLGYHDIDFDSSPEFSRRYMLRSKQAETGVRDLFTPSVRAFFEQREPLSVEGQEGGVLVYRGGRRVKPEELRSFVEDAQLVARQFERG